MELKQQIATLSPKLDAVVFQYFKDIQMHADLIYVGIK
jgi:hypothetical protein